LNSKVLEAQMVTVRPKSLTKLWAILSKVWITINLCYGLI